MTVALPVTGFLAASVASSQLSISAAVCVGLAAAALACCPSALQPDYTPSVDLLDTTAACVFAAGVKHGVAVGMTDSSAAAC